MSAGSLTAVHGYPRYCRTVPFLNQPSHSHMKTTISKPCRRTHSPDAACQPSQCDSDKKHKLPFAAKSGDAILLLPRWAIA